MTGEVLHANVKKEITLSNTNTAVFKGKCHGYNCQICNHVYAVLFIFVYGI